MKYAAVAAALLAAPLALAQSSYPTATTTIMTTQYSTYVYTVYDTTVYDTTAVPTTTPIANSTVPVAPTGGSNSTISVITKPTTLGGAPAGPSGSGSGISPSISPVPHSGAAGLTANWMVGAAVAGFAAVALF